MEKAKQKLLFESGNELAAYAAKQINYHLMGYYPITPSTQIAEYLDRMKADGLHDISMIPAEGEHSAAGICYGAAAGGGRRTQTIPVLLCWNQVLSVDQRIHISLR